MDSRKVVITGLGVITPNGTGVPRFRDSLLKGVSGINKITRFDTSDYPTKIAGEVKDFSPTDYIEPKIAKRLSRFAQFAFSAAKMALEDAKIKIQNNGWDEDFSYRVGIVLGTSIGGQEVDEEQYEIFKNKGVNRINPIASMAINNNMAVGFIAQEFNIKGPNLTISTGCSSGLNAIACASDLIRNNKADIVIAGGSEAPITPFAFDTFCAAQALTKRNDNPEKASRPFDKYRDGYILSEGSGIVILEDSNFALKRGASIYAEIAGYAITNDAYSLLKMEPSGKEVSRTIKFALKNAGLSPESIDYINAHGSSSVVSDSRETKAIKDVFGERAYQIPISSIKSMIGQPLAATGAIQVIASVISMKEGCIPPTINYEYPDPECDLDYVPNKIRKHKINTVLINAFGLGGNNISLIIKKWNCETQH